MVTRMSEYLPPPNCTQVMTEWLRRNQRFNVASFIPMKISKELMDKFTKNGLIQLITKTDPKKLDNSPITWTRDQIEELILKDADKFEEYGSQGRAMLRAMQKFEVNGKTGLIFSSTKTPWIEAFAFQEGARRLIRTGPVNITIENYHYVKYVNPLEMALQYSKFLNSFDFAASFSIENVGFGLVDSLNPDGDILEVRKAHCMLKENGLLFLGIPVGWDTVVWNSHRIYGRIRFGLITAGWDVVTMFHYDKEIPIDFEHFEEDSEEQKWVVVVLRKPESI